MMSDYKIKLRSRSSDGDGCEGLKEAPLMNSEKEPEHTTAQVGSPRIESTPICHNTNTPTPSKLLDDVVQMWRVSRTPGRKHNTSSLDTSALSDVSKALSEVSEATDNDIPAREIEIKMSPSTPVIHKSQVPNSVQTSADLGDDTLRNNRNDSDTDIELSSSPIIPKELSVSELPSQISSSVQNLADLGDDTITCNESILIPELPAEEIDSALLQIHDEPGVKVTTQQDDEHAAFPPDELAKASFWEGAEPETLVSDVAPPAAAKISDVSTAVNDNTKSKSKRKRNADKDTKKPEEKKRGKLEKNAKRTRRTVKRIRRNQSTICDQLRDMDMKMEIISSALTKFDIPTMLEDISKTLNKQQSQQQSKQNPNVSDECNCHCKKTKKTNNSTQTLEEPTSQTTSDIQLFNKTVSSLEAQIDVLNGEIANKDVKISSLQTDLRQATQNKTAEVQQLKGSLAAVKNELSTAKATTAKYEGKQNEWDVMMLKKTNDIQKLQLTNNNLERDLKRAQALIPPTGHRGPPHPGRQPIPPQTPQPNDHPHPPPKPDVLLLHDSLGHTIREGIMVKQNLITAKKVTFTLEQVETEIEKLKVEDHKPKVIVIHSGTNNLNHGETAEQTLPKYHRIIDNITNNMPQTKIVLSTIVPRLDKKPVQRQIDFINASLNRKYGDSGKVEVVINNDILGFKLRGKDGIHLKDDGTRKLARHIRDGVISALNIEV